MIEKMEIYKTNLFIVVCIIGFIVSIKSIDIGFNIGIVIGILIMVIAGLMSEINSRKQNGTSFFKIVFGI